MKLSQRRLWIVGLIILGVILFLTLISAPASNKLNQGSTYSRSPTGYGAWYEYMSKRGTPIKRWQKSFDALSKQNSSTPLTLLRINPSLVSEDVSLTPQIKDWLKQGNTLILLGISEPVTAATFSTLHSHTDGEIKIDTRRRKKDPQTSLLSDNEGAIVWSENMGTGKLIAATTPLLAANAYQEFRGNYEFLAQLVTQQGKSIWVDEFLHGYKDKETIIKEGKDNIFSYFQKTPFLLLMVQGLILLILAIWAENRRLGRPIPLATPSVNNSEAYIQGLAEVLHKAKRSEFVVSMLTPAEQKQLQKTLGLGEALLEPQVLLKTIQQTGQSLPELEALVTTSAKKSFLNATALQTWLVKWHQVQQQAQEKGIGNRS